MGMSDGPETRSAGDQAKANPGGGLFMTTTQCGLRSSPKGDVPASGSVKPHHKDLATGEQRDHRGHRGSHSKDHHRHSKSMEPRDRHHKKHEEKEGGKKKKQ